MSDDTYAEMTRQLGVISTKLDGQKEAIEEIKDVLADSSRCNAAIHESLEQRIRANELDLNGLRTYARILTWIGGIVGTAIAGVLVGLVTGSLP